MPQSPHEFDFRGAHDGYERLADPVRHMRSVRFDAATSTLTVRDEVSAKKQHQVELFWHFAPGLDARLNSSGLHVRGKRFALVAKDGVVTALHVENGGEFKVSTAENVLASL